MSFSLYLFDSDYIGEKIIALDNCMLLCSKIPNKTPRVFFTEDLDKDCECDILVIKVPRTTSETYQRGEIKVSRKLAKVVIVTETPLASFDSFHANGLSYSFVLMRNNKVLHTVNSSSRILGEATNVNTTNSNNVRNSAEDSIPEYDGDIPSSGSENDTVSLKFSKRVKPAGPWSNNVEAVNSNPASPQDETVNDGRTTPVLSYSQGSQSVNNKPSNIWEMYGLPYLPPESFVRISLSAPEDIWIDEDDEEFPSMPSTFDSTKSRIFRHVRLLESDVVEHEDFDYSEMDNSTSSLNEFQEYFSIHADDNLFRIRKHKGIKRESPSSKKRKKADECDQKDELD